jgi:hypothetical protein
MQSPHQDIKLTSDPTHAQVTLNSQEEQFKTKTPAVVTLTRKQNYTLLFEKEDYEPSVISLESKAGGWVWGNLILGGIIGIITDETAGSSRKFDTSVVHVNLLPKKQKIASYEKIKKAQYFSIGPVGIAGTLSEAELEITALLEDKKQSAQVLRKLLEESTPAGQMYALFGLKLVDIAYFEKVFPSYAEKKETIHTMSGCIASEESIGSIANKIKIDAYRLKK